MRWSVVCIIKDRVIIAAPSAQAPTEQYFGELEERQFNFLFAFEFGVVAWYNGKGYIKDRKTKGREAHHIDWSKDRIRTLVIGAIAGILAVFYIGAIPVELVDSIIMDTRVEDHEWNKYPFVIGTEAEEEFLESNSDFDSFDGPTTEKSRSLFIKNQFSLKEEYSVEDMQSRMTQKYYELRTGWKKESFMKSVLAEYAAEQERRYNYAPVKWESDCFDTVYYLEIDENTYELIAAKGNKMLFLNFFGQIYSEKMLKMMEELKWEN